MRKDKGFSISLCHLNTSKYLWMILTYDLFLVLQRQCTRLPWIPLGSSPSTRFSLLSMKQNISETCVKRNEFHNSFSLTQLLRKKTELVFNANHHRVYQKFKAKRVKWMRFKEWMTLTTLLSVKSIQPSSLTFWVPYRLYTKKKRNVISCPQLQRYTV